jgi:hypothetical protein
MGEKKPILIGVDTIYRNLNYLKIWGEYDNAEPLELLISSDKGVFEISLLCKKIDLKEEIYESYVPYGYGGPILVEGKEDATFPVDLFLLELRKRNIIDCFIRFSPFLSNHLLFPQKLLELNRYTISRKLESLSREDLLNSFSKGTKWSIKKSMYLGVNVLILNGTQINPSDLENFYKLYYNNMKFINADDYYFLNYKCVENHFKYLSNSIDLFVAKVEDKWVASSIFLKDDNIVHYHLSASDYRYSKFYPVDRILFEAINFYGKEGKKLLHLGGGLKLGLSDSLLNFKMKFGKIVNEFFVSKIIVDEKLYKYLRAKNKIEGSKYFLINDALKRKL